MRSAAASVLSTGCCRNSGSREGFGGAGGCGASQLPLVVSSGSCGATLSGCARPVASLRKVGRCAADASECRGVKPSETSEPDVDSPAVACGQRGKPVK